jgi:hypothetical protein
VKVRALAAKGEGIRVEQSREELTLIKIDSVDPARRLKTLNRALRLATGLA